MRQIPVITPKLIHTMLGKIGMQDEEYRALLRDKFKKNSSKELTLAQKTLLINHLRRLLNTYKPPSKFAKPQEKPQVRLIYSLWQEMSGLGIVRNPNGLSGFVKKLTEIDKPEWLSPEQLKKVIQALMAMKRRGKNVQA